MKFFGRTTGSACLLLLVPALVAAQEKSNAEEKPAAAAAKVHVVLSEFDGTKKITSLPYDVTLLPKNEGLREWQSIRTGARVPAALETKDSKYQYVDVGTNIDCALVRLKDGRYDLSVSLDRSSFLPGQSSETAGSYERLPGSNGNLPPLLRQFKTSFEVLLRDGQTVEGSTASDPINGHVWKTEVTLSVLK